MNRKYYEKFLTTDRHLSHSIHSTYASVQTGRWVLRYWDFNGGSMSQSQGFHGSKVQMVAQEFSLPWLALHVKPGREKFVASLLHQKGYEEFLPLYVARHRWSDRNKEVELPLFSGYLFCRCNPNNRLPILTTPHVNSILGPGKVPEPVPETEIASVQAIVRSGLGVEPWPYLRSGERVRLTGGPLFGIEGILVEAKRRRRFVVSVTLLQRSVAVEVDSRWIAPANPGHFLAPAGARLATV